MTSQLQRLHHPLRVRERPEFEVGTRTLRLVDLFCGCGGLTLGVAQAARELDLALDVRLAIDLDPSAMAIYKANFPKARADEGDVESLFDGALGAALTRAERRVRRSVGNVDLLVGGPPCQGHSDLNNHTRRNDPKNELYLRMARAAEVLHPWSRPLAWCVMQIAA